MPTLTEARDAILELFETRWLADSPAVAGGAAPKIFFEAVPDPGQQPQTASWCRIQIRHTTAEQASFGQVLGERRFRKLGIVTVQIFALMPAGNLTEAEGLAAVARSAFERRETPNHVWFRNVRINEVGVEGTHFQMNVLADFEYDEFVS